MKNKRVKSSHRLRLPSGLNMNRICVIAKSDKRSNSLDRKSTATELTEYTSQEEYSIDSNESYKSRYSSKEFLNIRNNSYRKKAESSQVKQFLKT